MDILLNVLFGALGIALVQGVFYLINKHFDLL